MKYEFYKNLLSEIMVNICRNVYLYVRLRTTNFFQVQQAQKYI